MTTTENYAPPSPVRQTAAPDLMAALTSAEVSTLRFHPPTRDADRLDLLRELAEWSITTAELDWEHAEDIDRRGWGEH